MDHDADNIIKAMRLDREAVESGAMIAELDADSAGLLVGLMQRNADDAMNLQDQLYKGLEDERDRWRERALIAEAELDAVRSNVMRLLHPTETQVTMHYDRDHTGGM